MKTNATINTLSNKRGLHLLALAAVALFLLVLAGTAQAQYTTNVIYQDNFARTGLLTGTIPSPTDNWYTNATGGGGYYTNANANAIWWASDAPQVNQVVLTDGSEIAYTNTPDNGPSGIFMNGYLPFTPQVGHKYIYTISLYGFAAGGNNWLAAGYAENSITNNYYAAANCGLAWLLMRATGASYQAFLGPGTASSATISAGCVAGGTNTFTIILDTTTGTAASGWTVSWYCNGVLGRTASYGSNPTFNYVGIGGDAANGYMQNFSLTNIIAPSTIPTINEQPNNAAVSVGQTATFWVNAVGNPAPVYQWMTNGPTGPTNAITGATGAVYTTPATTPTYNNLKYSVVVANFSGSVTSTPATLSVANSAATIFSAVKANDGITNNLTNIVVTFSKPVNPATALNSANYALNNSATVTAVSNYGSTSNAVLLMTSLLSTNASYSLTVQNVQDFYGNTMTAATVPVLPAGLAIYLRGNSGIILDNNGNVAEWLDQTTNGNNTVQNILGGPSARPAVGAIGGEPALAFNSASSNFLTAATSPSLAVTNNITIYDVVTFADFNSPREVLSKTTGAQAAPYDYYANTAGQLLLSRGEGQNSGSFTSSGGAPVATPCVVSVTMTGVINGSGSGTVTHYLNGAPDGSGTLTVAAPSDILDTGNPLWVGGRNDLAQWMNGQMGEIMIFNEALSPSDRTNVDNYLGGKYFSTISIFTNLPASVTTSNGFGMTFSIAANQGSAHTTYQWVENGTNIPGATSQSYTTSLLAPTDNGDTFYVIITGYNGVVTNTVTNTLTVLSEPPFVTSAGIAIWNTNQIYVVYDEPVNPVTATVAGNYSLNSGSVISAVMGAEPNKVVLTTSGVTWNANPGTYSVKVQNVQDLYNNTIVTASTPLGLYPTGTALWLEGNTGVGIDSGGNPEMPGYTAVNQWNDQSGNVANLFQINGNEFEPVYTTNYHGNAGIQFSGTNTETITVGATSYGYSTFLSSAGYSGLDYPCLEITNDISIFAVATFNSLVGGTNGEIVGKTGIPPNTGSPVGTGASKPAPYDYYVSGGPNALLYRGDGTNFGAISSTSGPSLGVPHIIGTMQSGSTVYHFLDGATNGSGVISRPEPYIDQGQPMQIGLRDDEYNRLDGQLFELIMISSALDSNDLVSIGNYLASKYTIPTGANAYPAITKQPVASTNVYEYTTLTVPVGVSGNPLAIQWYSTNGATVVGQTSTTLSIPNIQATNSYYLVATNIYGAVTSSVVAVGIIPINPNPTNIILLATNNVLNLSWPLDHTGWILQAQTNRVSVGISNNWVNVSGSGGTNQVIIPVNLTNGTVFYRLMFP